MIPTSILKYVIEVLAVVLCFIINNALKFGVFPEQLKLSIVTPVYQSWLGTTYATTDQ